MARPKAVPIALRLAAEQRRFVDVQSEADVLECEAGRLAVLALCAEESLHRIVFEWTEEEKFPGIEAIALDVWPEVLARQARKVIEARREYLRAVGEEAAPEAAP